MIAEIGLFALIAALVVALAQGIVPMIGAARGDTGLMMLGRAAAVVQALLVALSFGALAWLFTVHDFSVKLVADHAHSTQPVAYRFAATWGNHEGSMLLWILILAVFGAGVAVWGGNLRRALQARVIAIQGLIGAAFLGFSLFTSNPFLRLFPAPVDGAELNPLLQDPGLVFHPPLLYTGYVGFSVTFAFAMAALIEGRVDAAWARWVRPWTLAAWSLLTLGIGLGAFWAYYELGWGGWWFWDPVENASFMPWLIGAALLHSAVVTEKRGALSGWTVFLALAAFTFSMLGAFLVRSGVLTSVHAFAVDPTRGVLLLTILGVASGAGFALFAWRAPALQRGGLFAPVSRESLIVLNNIILTAATATVLLGTLYPLIREAMDGDSVSVGPPYFNLTFTPLMVVAMLLLPFGPLTAWKRGDARAAADRLKLAAAAAVVFGVAAYAVVSPRKVLAAAGLAVGFWLLFGALAEVAERTRAFRAPMAETMRRLVGLPLGAWGMTLAHMGLGVFTLGAVFETAWKIEAAEALSLGGRIEVGAYSLSLDQVRTVEGPNFLAERGTVSVTRGGQTVCTAEPERRFYPTGRQTTSEVALCHRGLDQIYIVLGERRASPDGGPAWLVRGYFNPWVQLIFVGPLLMAIGGLVSLSDRRLRLAAGRKAA